MGLRLERELLGRVDAARGDVPRNRWIVRALEAALDALVVEGNQSLSDQRQASGTAHAGSTPPHGDREAPVPASPRTPKPSHPPTEKESQAVGNIAAMTAASERKRLAPVRGMGKGYVAPIPKGEK